MTPIPSSKSSKGRPTKAAHLHRIHKVTVSFTEDEYRHLKHLAGHQPIHPTDVSGGKTTARPCRHYGSIAGHIRAMLQQNRPGLTADQFLLLNRLVAICGELSELANRSKTGGLLAISVSLTRTQERISGVLDEIDRDQRRPTTQKKETNPWSAR